MAINVPDYAVDHPPYRGRWIDDDTRCDDATCEGPEIVELRLLAKRDPEEFDKIIGARFGELIASHEISCTPMGWLVLDATPEGSVSLNNLPFPSAVHKFVTNIETPRPAPDPFYADSTEGLLMRLEYVKSCEPGCEGRCRVCPADVIEEAIQRIKNQKVWP